MSNFDKKKFVINELTKGLINLPASNELIVKVLFNPGNNLHQVEDINGEQFLVSMPNKFRRIIWIGRNSFVLVKPIKEGRKVRAEITNILTQDHISYFNEEGIWPKQFSYAVEKRNSSDLYKTSYDPLEIVNHNRVAICESDSSWSDSENSSDEDSSVSSNFTCSDEEIDESEISDEEEGGNHFFN